MKDRMSGYRHQFLWIIFWMLTGAFAYELLKRSLDYLWNKNFQWDLEVIVLILIYGCVLTAMLVLRFQNKSGKDTHSK